MPKAQTREFKSFAFEIKSIDDQGKFTGIASVYGNVDLGGDLVQKGAFTKTLAERGTEVPILWQHKTAEPIGLGTLTDGPDGLMIEGQLCLDTVRGKEAYALMKAKIIKGFSIGYDTIKQKFEKGVRNLLELKLWEVSCVTFPMNEEALLTSVKSIDGLLPFQTARHLALLQLDKKDLSLQDKISALYAEVREVYPLSNVWIRDAYDDRVIVCVGGDRHFQIAVTWTDDEPTLGEAIEVENIWVPVGTGAAAAVEIKAGRTISAANATKLKTAHEHAQKAVDHLTDVLAAADPKNAPGTLETKDAAHQAAESDAIHSLRAMNESLRALTGAAK